MTTTTRQTKPRIRKPPVVREYTREEKIRAVTAILTVASDKPTGKRARDAAKSTGVDVDVTTLHDWTRLYRDEVMAVIKPAMPTDVEIIKETHDKIAERMSQARNDYLEHTLKPEVVAATSARDAAVVFGIMDDHVAKAEAALDPEEIQLTLEIREEMSALGLTGKDALRGLLATVRARKDKKVRELLDGETHAALGTGEE